MNQKPIFKVTFLTTFFKISNCCFFWSYMVKLSKMIVWVNYIKVDVGLYIKIKTGKNTQCSSTACYVLLPVITTNKNFYDYFETFFSCLLYSTYFFILRLLKLFNRKIEIILEEIIHQLNDLLIITCSRKEFKQFVLNEKTFIL